MDIANFTNMRTTRVGHWTDLMFGQKSEVFVEDKSKIASRVGW